MPQARVAQRRRDVHALVAFLPLQADDGHVDVRPGAAGDIGQTLAAAAAPPISAARAICAIVSGWRDGFAWVRLTETMSLPSGVCNERVHVNPKRAGRAKRLEQRRVAAEEPTMGYPRRCRWQRNLSRRASTRCPRAGHGSGRDDDGRVHVATHHAVASPMYAAWPRGCYRSPPCRARARRPPGGRTRRGSESYQAVMPDPEQKD